MSTTKPHTPLLSLSAATQVVMQAADIVFVLQNKASRSDYRVQVAALNAVRRQYDRQGPEITYADLDELKIISRKLYAVFAAKNIEDAASIVNVLFHRYGSIPQLSIQGGEWRLYVGGSDQVAWAEGFAASSVWALAVLLAEKQTLPGGLCASPSCKRPFIGLGKGGHRNYCSPRCATRERVAAYRRKAKL